MSPGDKVILENTMCYTMDGGDLVPIAYAVVTVIRLVDLPGRKDVIFMSPFSRVLLRTSASNTSPYEQREKPATNIQQQSGGFAPVKIVCSISDETPVRKESWSFPKLYSEQAEGCREYPVFKILLAKRRFMKSGAVAPTKEATV